MFESNAARFWRAVRLENEKVVNIIRDRLLKCQEAGNNEPMEGQLVSGVAVYITSVERPLDAEWRGGQTFIASVDLAARRIVESTHRLSTKADIDEFLSRQSDSKKAALLAQASLDGKKIIQVSPIAPAPAPARKAA